MGNIVHRLRDWRNLHLALGGELFEAAADEIERLRLTADEREAVEAAIAYMQPVAHYDNRPQSTLRKLLERIK